ncbi:hypothetical protein [Actinomadura rugatobispora]|uniref:Uncharacterized protein n=1 Tax=Actinomadura rugatobispora TaxID=1994 RepID=A0ABW1AK99_9ACTN|nr:hypothetical protein GCM10010200_031240 [Actinomadura rugatobispora]
MTALTYTIFTDPAPLEASASGRRSRSIATVYLVVTNTARKVDWRSIEVKVPVGDGAGHVGPDIPEMKGEYTTNPWEGEATTAKVRVERQQGTNVFKVTPQAGDDTSFKFGDYLVLKLENIAVATTAGLAVLTVREKTEDDDGEHTRYTSVALVKTAPKEIAAPRDFRPDKAMVDEGDTLTLSWEGSAEFDYKVLFPGGEEKVPAGSRAWRPANAPKRATTYTLVATDPVTRQQHFLTTTVQARYPVLEKLTATTGIDTPWVQGRADETRGRLTFTGAGVEIFGNSGAKGTVTADKADLNGVTTEWVQGKNTDDGKITFPKDGLDIRQGSGSWGVVHADKADLNGINTKWVQGRSTNDGWISFPQDGLNVSEGGGSWGVVHAEKADLNGINTKWVQGRSADDGWISFSQEGIKVNREDGDHLTHLVVGYATLDIVKTRVVRGLKDDDGWISFRKEGLNVHRERGTERGTVFADKLT